MDLGTWSVTALLPDLPAGGQDGDAKGGMATTAAAARAAAVASAAMAATAAAVKRQRGAGGGPKAAAGASEAAGGRGLSVRLTVYAQQRGRFDVMAIVPKTVSDEDALRFTLLMQKVEGDVAAQWQQN